ncbi:MAG: hypothetical protein JKY37_25580 [Nannocystaceae bacterium]|nr:hypothetical protein [Nannocystaceae bacterium]
MPRFPDIPQSEFWTPEHPGLDRVVGDMLAAGVEATTLFCPEHAHPGRVPMLPLLVSRAQPLSRKNRSDFHEEAVLTAVGVEDQRMFAAPLLRPPSEVAEEDDEPYDPPSGMSGVGLSVDAQERLQLPDDPASYVLRVLTREQRSNPVRVEVVPDPQRFADPSVTRLRKAHRDETGLHAVWPTLRAGVSYATDASTTIPAAQAIVLAAQSALFVSESTRWILRGAFRLPVEPRNVVPPDQTDNPAYLGATAVVPIHLLLLGSEFRGPQSLTLYVPGFASTLADERTVVGKFAIDLLSMPQIARRLQTHFIYALAGSVISDPCLSALVPEVSS